MAIFILILSLQGFAFAEKPQLRPLDYDGCTLFPEGTKKDPKLWDHCCFEHDVFYWAGGSKSQRKVADLNLRQCVRDVGKPGLADIMYFGIRMGRLYPFQFGNQQYGNAWAKKRNYREHSQDDIHSIFNELDLYTDDDELKQRLWDVLHQRAFEPNPN